MGYNSEGVWENPISLKAKTKMEEYVNENLWKTKRIASTFHVMTGLPQDELESVARMCLMKCVSSYNPEAPANFSTWVNRCLYLHMLNFLRDKSRMIKIPRKYTSIYLKVRRLFKEDKKMTYKRAAEILNIPYQEIINVNACFKTKITDINFFAEEIIGEEEEGVVSDYLLDKVFELDEEKIEEGVNSFDASIMDSFSDKEVNILNDVLIRGLCNNTLERHFKKSAFETIKQALELMEGIYYHA